MPLATDKYPNMFENVARFDLSVHPDSQTDKNIMNVAILVHDKARILLEFYREEGWAKPYLQVHSCMFGSDMWNTC